MLDVRVHLTGRRSEWDTIIESPDPPHQHLETYADHAELGPEPQSVCFRGLFDSDAISERERTYS